MYDSGATPPSSKIPEPLASPLVNRRVAMPSYEAAASATGAASYSGTKTELTGVVDNQALLSSDTIIKISGATAGWASLNGTWKLTVTSGHYNVSLDSSGLAGQALMP